MFMNYTAVKELKCMDGWTICDFTSFQQYFNYIRTEGRMIMKVCVQWNPVEKNSPRAGLELGTVRSVGQCLTH